MGGGHEVDQQSTASGTNSRRKHSHLDIDKVNSSALLLAYRGREKRAHLHVAGELVSSTLQRYQSACVQGLQSKNTSGEGMVLSYF